MAMTICGKCGAQNPASNHFCGQCGASNAATSAPHPAAAAPAAWSTWSGQTRFDSHTAHNWLIAGGGVAVVVAAVIIGVAMSATSSPIAIHVCSFSEVPIDFVHASVCPHDDHSIVGAATTRLYFDLYGHSSSTYNPDATVSVKVGQQQANGSYAYDKSPNDIVSNTMSNLMSPDGHSFSMVTIGGYGLPRQWADFEGHPSPGQYRLDVEVVNPDGSTVQAATYDLTVQ